MMYRPTDSLDVEHKDRAVAAHGHLTASSTFSSAGALDSVALATDVGEEILRKWVFDLNQRQIQIFRQELHYQSVAVSSKSRPQPAEEKAGLFGSAADLRGFRLG